MEFFFIYGMQISKFGNTALFKKFGNEYFVEPTKVPVWENLLYYIVLSNFCMMVSAFYITVSKDDANKIFVRRFTARINSPKT